MQGIKVNREGDFRSLGSSGVFDALPGSQYGSSADLTGSLKPRPLPKALQPKTVKDQQPRSFSYRQPVVALPPRTALTIGSTESPEGRRYGNTERSNGYYGDQSPSNRIVGNQLHSYQSLGTQVLASKPRSFLDSSGGSGLIRNQRPGPSVSLRNPGGPFEPPTLTPGTAQAHAQMEYIERKLKGGEQPAIRKVEKENRTWQNDVGYRSAPLSNFRNRRNSSCDAGQNSAPTFVQNSHISRSSASTFANPRSTRYGSLLDLSRDSGETGQGDRQAGGDVDSYGLILMTSGPRRDAVDSMSSEPDEEVFRSSETRDKRRSPPTSENSHVTGNAWNRGLDEASPLDGSSSVGRSSSTQMMANRLDSWNRMEKTPNEVKAREDDRHTYTSKFQMVRNRRSSFDQTLPRRENYLNNYSSSDGSQMNGNPVRSPARPAPWARPSAKDENIMQGSFRPRTQSTTSNHFRDNSGDTTDPPPQVDSTALALKSSRYPSAKIADSGSDVMTHSERVATSPWATNYVDARGTQSSGDVIHTAQHPVENRLRSRFRDDIIPNDIDAEFSSISSSPLTSETTGNQRDSLRSVPDVTRYSAAQTRVTSSSLYDVRCDNRIHASSDHPTEDKNLEQRSKERSNFCQGSSEYSASFTGDIGARKSPLPGPMPAFSYQTTRRNSLPVVALERKDATTRGKVGNYESIFSKGDWMNGSRMTWRSPSSTPRGETPAVGKPISAGGKESLSRDRKTTPADNPSATPSAHGTVSVEQSKPMERSAIESAVQECRNSGSLPRTGADPYGSNSRISPGRSISGNLESSREFSNAKIPKYSTYEERSFSFINRPETTNSRESASVELSKSAKDREPAENRQNLLKRPEADGEMLEDIRDRELPEYSTKQSSSKSYSDVKTQAETNENYLTEREFESRGTFDSEKNQPESTMSESGSSECVLDHSTSAFEPRQPAAEASTVDRNIRQDENGVGSNPVARESTRPRTIINWKEWYYAVPERTRDADQSSDDRAPSTAQVSDHESGYQSSGPTLDDLPLRKSSAADRKAVQKDAIASGVSIEPIGCESDSENTGHFPSGSRLPASPKTSDPREKSHLRRNLNGEDGFHPGNDGEEKKYDGTVPGSARVEVGGPREVEIHVRGGALGVGFSIEGGIGSTNGDRPITVKRIFTGGDHLRQKLNPGDAILRVNDKDFTRMTHYDAWNYLKTLPEGPALLFVDTN